MRITILGASGFIGRHLTVRLRDRGDTVIEASLRDMNAAVAACAGSEVVVNLAGAPVAGGRWTPAFKEEIRRSRVDLTRALVTKLGAIGNEPRPKAYVSASAIGYYGASPTETFTEESAPGTTFLARVCVDWEREAANASAYGMRVAILRTGIVLAADGGALQQLIPIYNMGGGGPVASGKQWCSWIHMDDQVEMYVHAIDGATGVFNATAPEPVTNARFSHALAAALHRPALIPTPAFALRFMFGEGATILTEGQNVLPARLLQSGFRFRFSQIEPAMEDAVRAR